MFIEFFQYGFAQNAVLGGVLIALVSAIMGTFLVLKRLSMIGDALAHVAFGGIALGLLLGVNPILSALVATVLGSLWVQRLVERTKVYAEAAMALILSIGIGLAVVIIGVVNGFNVNLFSYLFGSILTVSGQDIALIGVLAALVLGFIWMFYRQLMFVIFNEEVARISGVNVGLLNTVLSILTAITVVISIRAVGIMLISALLVVPAITALQWADSFRKTLLIAIGVSLFSVLAGILLAFQFNLPVGGVIVLLLAALFALTTTVKHGLFLEKHRA